MRGFFIFEGTPSFLKKYQKGTPNLLIAVPQPQVILERPDKEEQDMYYNIVLNEQIVYILFFYILRFAGN